MTSELKETEFNFLKKNSRISDLDNSEGTFSDYDLLRACSEGDINLVQACLDFGVDINCQDEAGISPVMQSVLSEKDQVVALLVRKGADLEWRDFLLGTNSLILAVCLGLYEITRILIEAGAQVNARDRQGRTALYEAISAGDINIIQLLIQNGAVPQMGIHNLYRPLSLNLLQDCRKLEENHSKNRGEKQIRRELDKMRKLNGIASV